MTNFIVSMHTIKLRLFLFSGDMNGELCYEMEE